MLWEHQISLFVVYGIWNAEAYPEGLADVALAFSDVTFAALALAKVVIIEFFPIFLELNLFSCEVLQSFFFVFIVWAIWKEVRRKLVNLGTYFGLEAEAQRLEVLATFIVLWFFIVSLINLLLTHWLEILRTPIHLLLRLLILRNLLTIVIHTRGDALNERLEILKLLKHLSWLLLGWLWLLAGSVGPEFNWW